MRANVLVVLALACASSACRSAKRAEGPGPLDPLTPGETGYAVTCAKLFTMDDADHVYAPGMLLVRNAKIVAVGEHLEVPAGFERRDFGDAWCTPGLVDLHSHVQTGGWGDINDMVLPINAEFRTSPTIVPGNPDVKRACSAGITTLFGIPGSGTSISGFGVLYKTKCSSTYDQAVLRDPGGMKVAQDSNPQRGAGDLGVARCALGWILEEVNDRARAANAEGRFDLALENLKRVHRKELPVIIHTAGSDGVMNTARMWRTKYDTRAVLTHGCFDAWKTAPAVTKTGIAINNGPRTMDYFSSRDGRIVGVVDEWVKAGASLISVNTDAGVMPEEEFFLQGAMSSRLGADSYLMLQAVTIHPAKAIGIADRVGSLEVGKDADLVVFNGDPLDPRARVEIVWIDGQIEYDRARDGQRF